MNNNNFYNERKQKMIDVFYDTIKRCGADARIKQYTDFSTDNTKIYNSVNMLSNLDNVVITQNRTYEAARKMTKVFSPKKKIAVLNFASATIPGGGVKKGSIAQEECLCRSSNLYIALAQKKVIEGFYEPNKAIGDPLHNDSIVYSPSIMIFKDDDTYEYLSPDDYITVDVITCAAPNLREKPNNSFNIENKSGEAAHISAEELYNIHVQRAKAILEVAILNRVDLLVLGAFGCGAFKNDPHVVAQAYHDILLKYAPYFTQIEFAIYCGSDKTNYNAFVDAFKKI